MTALATALEARLGSSDPEERRRATAELLPLEPQDSAPLVLQALGDSDWRVRKEAVRVALACAPSPVLLKRLVDALSSSDDVGLRNAVVEALGGYGDDAVDHLAVALSRFDADARKLAIEALGRSGRAAAVPVLTRSLDDSDPNVRVAAVEAIAWLGAAGVSEVTPILERCLFAPEPLTALAALEGLNALGSVLPWGTVERCLVDPIRHRPALLAAGRTGDARAVPVLIEALSAARGSGVSEVTLALRTLCKEPDPIAALVAHRDRVSDSIATKLASVVRDEQEHDEHRRAALIVLGALGFPVAAECAIETLSDDRLIGEAHETLELLGARAVPALVDAAREGSNVSRGSCLVLLARLADDRHASAALGAARSALSDPSQEVQRAALALLARFGDATALVEVARSLETELSPATLNMAESALRELALRHEPAAREITANAAPTGADAHAACVVIGALGGRVRGALEDDIAFLSSSLSNPSPSARRAALEVLADLGGAKGVEAVAFALTDEERDVRRTAVAALGRMRGADGSAVGAQHLIDLVEHAPEPELLAAAVRALGDTEDPHAVPVLRPLFRSAQPFVAVSAVEALARVAGPRRVDALIECLTHPDAEVVKATMLALADAGDPRVIAHLGACLDHDAWDVRRLAADLLGRISGEPALEFLRARIPSEESPPVQEAITRALDRASGSRRTPVPAPLGSLRPR